MKKIITLALIVGLPFVLAAQTEQKWELETQGGYEYNYFKSPDQLIRDEVLLEADSLISSSAFQDVRASYRLKKEWGYHGFSLYASPEARIFYDQTDDSYWQARIRANYSYKWTRKLKFLAEVSFKRMNREGLDGAQDVLINPLGYTNYGVAAGVEGRWLKRNKTTLEVFYNFRNFDAFGIRDLQFDEKGVTLSSVQSFKPNELKHRFGISGTYKQRLYDTFNASNEVPNGERDWRYLRGNVFYEFPISKAVEVVPSYQISIRTDVLEERSGFTQYGPKLALRVTTPRTKIRGSFSYLTRDYRTLEARDNEGLIGEKIKYEYANFNLSLEHSLGNNLYATLSAYSRVRTTNYTDLEARSFRGYTNQYVGIGFSWQL
ncbi:hypothetical protein POV27_02245 [Aureisphaera galaxeae]|uniref:hypothetical protein n=1 Tax=Aureisphaera galaxeae TaxID=1538023 RepID=UPI002350E042|nr:hypothetical protein [Aureisphaera galaxeae]MDC8002862.1 hypothetical protein [Aureisphaera galaxeae]